MIALKIDLREDDLTVACLCVCGFVLLRVFCEVSRVAYVNDCVEDRLRLT